MAAADVAVDYAYLSTHLGVPETTISTVATQPTVDLVAAVLQAVAAKAHEYDALYAEKLQVDIELENAVRSSEARCQTFKATADKALKDVEEIRKKLQTEGEIKEWTRLATKCASARVWKNKKLLTRDPSTQNLLAKHSRRSSSK